MSAWMVSKTHIDALLTAATRPETHVYFDGAPVRFEDADSIGAALWAENLASVDYRYPDATDDNRPGPIDFQATDTMLYRFERLSGTVDPIVILKAIDCYEYQSCEHPGWETSEAHAFCTSLRSAMIAKLPRYNEAPWGIDDRRVFMVGGVSV